MYDVAVLVRSDVFPFTQINFQLLQGKFFVWICDGSMEYTHYFKHLAIIIWMYSAVTHVHS